MLPSILLPHFEGPDYMEPDGFNPNLVSPFT